MTTRRLHIREYHVKCLKLCQYCQRSYMEPWDYDVHMNNRHVWCELCKGYARDQEKFDFHYKEKHTPKTSSPLKVSQREPTPEETEEPEVESSCEPPASSEQDLSQSQQNLSQSQVSGGATTLETNREDRPYECKYCKRTFKKAPQLNMHINTKHRIHQCTVCEKRFTTEEGRDNHRADVHM